MAFSRLDLWRNPYRPGGFFLGREDWFGLAVGYASERHALTVGGSRGGKGAAVIIPNLRRWPESAVVIDPKGENAEETAAYRQDKLGIPSYVLDPFGEARVRKDLRASFNVFDIIRPDTKRGFSDVRTLTDGMMMRHDDKAAFFDSGAEDIMTGAIVDTLTNPRGRDDMRNLVGLRSRFKTEERFKRLLAAMARNPAMGGMAQAAAANIARAPENTLGSFLTTLEDNTRWIDDVAVIGTLRRSTFQLSELKRKRCTVYLVVPSDLLDIHGRFLRLFVRAALHTMAQRVNGSLKGTRTLFLLDEFTALGYLEQVETAAGLMPGYGVHLWPFVQNLGQLEAAYGASGASTFLANADVHQFFAANDPHTLGHIAARLGTDKDGQGREVPVASERELLAMIGKGKGDTVARNQIVFLPTGEALKLRLSPWFMPLELLVIPRALVAAVLLLIAGLAGFALL